MAQDGSPSDPLDSDALLTLVGDRVRRARERKGIPRRVLSELSGVSPRYLAQMEAGAGNVSIGLLQRVAAALDYRIEWLVAEEDPFDTDLWRLTELFRAADGPTRNAALRALTPEPQQQQKAQRLCLIGLRGAGKSTLGQMAGAALDLPFVELNREIEARGGMPVPEIMALYGPEGYRKLEADALTHVAETHDRVVLAVAGGIVSDPGTFATLLSRFHTIWLRAAPEDHMDRVRAQGDTRPMEGNPEAMDQLKTLLAAREALYARADLHIDTSGIAKEAALAALLDQLQGRGIVARAA